MLIIPSHNDVDPKRTADIILEEFKTLTSTGNRLEGDANCNDEEDKEDMQDHCEDAGAAALEDEEGQLQASEGEQQSSDNVELQDPSTPHRKQSQLDGMSSVKRGRHAGLSRGLERQLTRAHTPRPTNAGPKRKKDAIVEPAIVDVIRE